MSFMDFSGGDTRSTSSEVFEDVSHFFCSSQIVGEPGTQSLTGGPLRAGLAQLRMQQMCLAHRKRLESSDLQTPPAELGVVQQGWGSPEFYVSPPPRWAAPAKMTGRTLATATAKCFKITPLMMSTCLFPDTGPSRDLLVVHFKFDHQRVVSFLIDAKGAQLPVVSQWKSWEVLDN